MSKKREKFFIGDIIRKDREARGYTREQLAARADITSRYLAAIELNEKQPSLEIAKRLIRALGMPATKIFEQDVDIEDDESVRLLRLMRSCSSQEQKLITALIDTIIDNRAENIPSNSSSGS